MSDKRRARVEAMDRTRLPKGSTPKSSRWPRTTRRSLRIEDTLCRRQPDLTVVLEDVHDPHNVSAVLRSCDAVGILDVHLVYVQEKAPKRSFARTSSGSAAKWIRSSFHATIEECYAALRERGFSIFVSTLDGERDSLYELDLTEPVALVFGNEMRGASEHAVQGADGRFMIPMMGMVQSLNVSVACAVTLFEAMRQRQLRGYYDRPRLDQASLAQLAAEWLEK
ncbi:MAG: RNA methyltransferase [Chloroflexota bacterium]|nr:RNA methyltransferase [Chloroflexota bacterium]